MLSDRRREQIARPTDLLVRQRHSDRKGPRGAGASKDPPRIMVALRRGGELEAKPALRSDPSGDGVLKCASTRNSSLPAWVPLSHSPWAASHSPTGPPPV